MRLTETIHARNYSPANTVGCSRICKNSMGTNHKENDAPLVTLKNASSRQRWEMFHRAIAHAKECNHAATLENDLGGDEGNSSGPVLTIVR